MQTESVAHALAAAVSPVILISAYGLLLLSMTNRLGRAIDRARLLARDHGTSAAVQIDIITPRDPVNGSFDNPDSQLMVLAFANNSRTVGNADNLRLVLFLAVFLNLDVHLAVSVLFVISLASLVVSLCYFIVDIFRSLRALEADVASARGKS